MKKFNVNNSNKRIGHGIFNEENLKLFKKGVTISFFGFGMGLMLASCNPKIQEKETPVEIIEPVDGYVPDAIYMIELENGNLMFVPKENLREFGCTYDKDLDKAVAFCENNYQELVRKSEEPNVQVDPRFKDFKEFHDYFMNQYDEYIEQGPSIGRDEFIRQAYENYYKEYLKWTQEPYKPQIIDLAEEDRVNDLDEVKSFEGPFYIVDNYKVEKGDTVSEIAAEYVNNKEQRLEIIKEIKDINNLPDEDTLKEGQVISLPKVGEEDFDIFGCSTNEADMVDQYREYFDYVLNHGLYSITGDIQSQEMKEEIEKDIDTFNKESNNPDSEVDVVALAKETIKKINVNFGIEEPTLIVHRGR